MLPGLHYPPRVSSSPVDQEAQSHGTFHQDGVVTHILRNFRSPSTSLLIDEDTLPDRLLHPDGYPNTLSINLKQADLEESST